MSAETKIKIIEAVIDIIRNDYNNEELTLSKIAKRIDIAKSTIYEHFESKQDLVCEASIHLISNYEKRFVAIDIDSLSFKRSFSLFLEQMIDMLAEANALFQFMISDLSFESKPKFHERTLLKAQQTEELVGELLRNVLKKGVEEGKINSSLEYDSLMIYGGFLLGNVIQFINGKFKTTKEELIETLFHHGLKLLNEEKR